MASVNYLTEMILSIQNEVQTAVDYIGLASAQAGTELGKNEAILQIESLRVKLPFRIELESKNLKVTSKTVVPELATTTQLRNMLSTRQGFMLDLGGTGVQASFTKVKVDLLQPAQTNDNTESMRGEIEIVFSPLLRK
ncbi:MAG: hypothetical protein FWD46_02525 [Cystobacterineae bacterium]|nr:hypothetical protein [Cystobacterineae bacterium]